MTRSLREASLHREDWDEEFRERRSDLVHYVGVSLADPNVSIDAIRTELNTLSARVPTFADGESSSHWPVYGSLIASISHIAHIVKDVEPVQEVVVEEGLENEGAV